MSNPVRVCLGCLGEDADPKHLIDVGGGQIVAWHMDCCAIARECEVCREQIAGAKGAKGEQLRAHLLRTGSDPKSPGWTAPVNPSKE